MNSAGSLSSRLNKDAEPGITIVGTGAVGAALAVELWQRKFQIVSVLSRNVDRALWLAARVGSPPAFALTDSVPIDAGVVFLCVPDDAIAPTAGLLAALPGWEDKIAVHTSGALPASVLEPLGQKGAGLMSFHPVQTFSDVADSPFSGIYVGIEGDERAVQSGVRIARALGAVPFILSADQKPRYHLAASIASNFLVTLTAMACDVLESLGMNRRETIALLRPLITQTCANVTTDLPERVLTGPASRGDVRTLKIHLDAIREFLPQYEPLYRALLSETLALAHRDGRLDREKMADIERGLG